MAFRRVICRVGAECLFTTFGGFLPFRKTIPQGAFLSIRPGNVSPVPVLTWRDFARQAMGAFPSLFGPVALT